jgi:hypothetical protein
MDGGRCVALVISEIRLAPTQAPGYGKRTLSIVGHA